jgi:CRP/FNR family transcriptional regulator
MTTNACFKDTTNGQPSGAPASRESGVQLDMHELARLVRFELGEHRALPGITFTTRRIGAGEALYRGGDEFGALYVVRSGFFKTIAFDTGGTEQVLSFPMRGDVLGADGLASGRYTSEPIALEASEVVVVPFARITALAREVPALERIVYRLLSRELVREQGLLYVVGMLGAEARVAAFLLNLGDRFATLGYSRSSFMLRMTRQEIGSYLGLKLETVSRALSAFDTAGLITVHLKRIDVLDAAALRRCIEEPASAVASALTAKKKPASAVQLARPAVTRPALAAE